MRGAIVQLRRDPFARTTLERTTEQDSGRGCGWCGQHRPGGRLFHYRWAADVTRVTAVWSRKGFCGVSCYAAYDR